MKLARFMHAEDNHVFSTIRFNADFDKYLACVTNILILLNNNNVAEFIQVFAYVSK